MPSEEEDDNDVEEEEDDIIDEEEKEEEEAEEMLTPVKAKFSKKRPPHQSLHVLAMIRATS